MFGSGQSAAGMIEMPMAASDPAPSVTNTQPLKHRGTPTVIRPTFYSTLHRRGCPLARELQATAQALAAGAALELVCGRRVCASAGPT